MSKSKGLRIRLDDPRRFDSKVNFDGPTHPTLGTPCWLWLGSGLASGYGTFGVKVGHRKYRKPLAHRWNYERHVGPIPEGLVIDHLCKTPACVNPAHLEAVTQRENVLRGDSFAATRAQQTHCKRGGHELAGDNLIFRRNMRECRTCENEAQRRRYAARKAA